MNCKFCNAEVDETHRFCPFCGKDLAAETDATSETTEEPMEIQAEQAGELPEEAACEQPVGKSGKKVWKIVLAVLGAVAALGVLAVVLLYALGVDLRPRPNDIQVKDAYTVSDQKAAKTADKVIATIADKTLNNAHLRIYYRMQVLDFINYYGSYTSQLGLDYTKPLSEQECYYDGELTWEQYLLDAAIKTWQNYQILGLLAEEAGYVMGEDWQESLENLPKELETQAAEDGYESVDAMLQEVIGPGCTLETYMEYVRLAFLSNDFYSSESKRLTPDQGEIEAYFTEHEAEFQESGITKESGLVSSVRHILVSPKGRTENEETGETTYSDDEWAACYEEAEKILNEWKSGEATEESFAALVGTYTEDPGSVSTGGLYENIFKGSGMTENFQDWAIDMSRQPGDTGIVKTEFGYHIMYFVSGEAQWISSARTNLLAERTSAMINDAKEKWTMKVNFRKISIAELAL